MSRLLTVLVVCVMITVAAGCTSKPVSQDPSVTSSTPTASQTTSHPPAGQSTAIKSTPVQQTPLQPAVEGYPSFTLKEVGAGRWQIGPLIGRITTSYEWLDEETLLFSPGHSYSSIIDLRHGKVLDPNPISVPDMMLGQRVAFSPDIRQVAYVRQGDLVIREISSGTEMMWETQASADTTQWYLWWSPNGRYLVGSWRSIYEKFKTGRVWSLDRQTGEVRTLYDEPNGLVYYDAIWSPDGNQVVLRGTTPKGLFVNELVMADLPTSKVEVVVARNNQVHVERRILWDSKGQLQVTNVMTGPGTSRPVTFDPHRNEYEDEIMDSRICATELHFLTYERHVVLRIDLEPALRDAGIPTEGTAGRITATMSPDGRWVLLTGYLGPTEDQQTVFCGSVDLATKEIRIVKADPATGWARSIGWSGDKALIEGRQILAEYDHRSNTLIPLITGQDVYVAYGDERGGLYVGSRDIGNLRPDRSRELILTAESAETLSMNYRLSPSGRYLAVTRRSKAGDRHQETLEIIDLELLGR